MTDFEALLAPVFARLTRATHTVPASRFRPLPEHYVWVQVSVGRYSLEYYADWQGGVRDESNGFTQEFNVTLGTEETPPHHLHKWEKVIADDERGAEVHTWDEGIHAWV